MVNKPLGVDRHQDFVPTLHQFNSTCITKTSKTTLQLLTMSQIPSTGQTGSWGVMAGRSHLLPGESLFPWPSLAPRAVPSAQFGARTPPARRRRPGRSSRPRPRRFFDEFGAAPPCNPWYGLAKKPDGFFAVPKKQTEANKNTLKELADSEEGLFLDITRKVKHQEKFQETVHFSLPETGPRNFCLMKC